MLRIGGEWTIPQFRCYLDFNRNACKFLNQMLADESCIVRTPTASNDDSPNILEPLGNIAQTTQYGISILRRYSATKRVLYDFWNFHDFFQHKVFKTMFLCRFSAPLQRFNSLLNRLARHIAHDVSFFCENGELAVFKADDITGARK